ncbi:aminoglycoside phosphotransferase family protein [Glycomyces rhizosphaerae]|uniref:Aminoglycoside phosphotransferase family protein n=1 Tax=Glycomyces rhizosphaerae TaxID=2054422 RepID=A0ABV7PWG1_9ACTN
MTDFQLSDLVIDEDLVRAMLRDQHPDLAELELREVDGGWDNKMWRLGDHLAVRIPRTPRGPSLLDQEHRWMPEIAKRLPLPVSAPVRLGTATERFPATWLVTTWVAGEPLDHAPIERGAASAEALASFLAALHQEAPEDAPVNPQRSVPLKDHAEVAERGIEHWSTAETLAPMREIWNDALAAVQWDRAPVWIHGDLHPANAVAAEGTLAGVIDFGELCAGDPATDLAAAWLLLPEGAAELCLDAYPDVDEATVLRARGWALLRALNLLSIGHAGEQGWPGGKVSWKPAGEATIARLLA